MTRWVCAVLAVCLLSVACTSPDREGAAAPTPPPTVPSPTDALRVSSDPDVYRVAPDAASAGELVTVTFSPPKNHTWGVGGELYSVASGEWIAASYGWQGRNRQMEIYFPNDQAGFEDIGFKGSGQWTWRVPERLKPGNYVLRKKSFHDGRGPLEDRTTAWETSFEVIE